jgi:hypothetical protein
MMNLRKLSVLAITALLVTGISGISAIHGTAKAATTTASLPSTSLTDLITSLINNVGDDTFSIIDLTTLVSSVTAPTPLVSSASAASALHYAPTMAAPASSGTSTQHYGPYASGSTDSGTCGNDWANDLFDRHFTVFQNKNDGSLLVVEQFKDGSFTTPASDSPPVNDSPGACETSTTPAGTVSNGVTGNLHGYFVIPLPATESQKSTSPFCNADTSSNTGCDTTTFIDTHFTPACYLGGSGTCQVTTFFFHYSAGGQGLIINEWKNASADRGGNHGDIRSANL